MDRELAGDKKFSSQDFDMYLHKCAAWHARKYLVLLVTISFAISACHTVPVGSGAAREYPPTPPPPPPPSAAPAPASPIDVRVPIRYTVKSGDTLESIAITYLHDRDMWPDIWYANPNIKDPHKIRPGEILIVGYETGQPTLSVERNGQVVTESAPPPPSPPLLEEGETEMPKASARYPIPKTYFKSDTKKLGDIDDQLKVALHDAGYPDGELAYYSLPSGYKGFAVVTKFEQIDKNGVPLAPPQRWTQVIYETPLPPLDLSKIFQRASAPATGYFRVIVFVVSDNPLGSNSGKTESHEEAENLASGGTPVLPARQAQQTIEPDYVCIAYIYEYKTVPADNNGSISLFDVPSAESQLQPILIALQRRR